MTDAKKIDAAIQRIAGENDADLLFYSGSIRFGAYAMVLEALEEKKGKNLMLFLTTLGGDPNEAYRIARLLARTYENLTACIGGLCKSAGTLVCVAANNLAMGPRGELGPLDMQLAKQDEIVDMESGLVGKEALNVLHREAYDAFIDHLLRMKMESQVSTRFAASMAKDLVIGLFGGLYSQLDPVRLGELERNCVLAVEYGDRLATRGGNLRSNGMKRLAAEYPSHGFVIDRDEAKSIFERVRAASDDELYLIESMDLYLPKQRPVIELFVGKDAKKPAGRAKGKGNDGAGKNGRESEATLRSSKTSPRGSAPKK